MQEGKRKQDLLLFHTGTAVKMNKRICREVVQKLTCMMLVCGIFLGGCGQIEPVLYPEEETGKGQGTEKPEEAASASDREEEDIGEEGETDAEEILARLMEDADAGFRERVWHDADIREEDSEEIILQKLGQCESLILRELSYKRQFTSLRGLSLLPNLKELVVDVNPWEEFRIGDFTPIAELSHLEKLYINYDTGNEIDLSFLADMKTIRELYLPNCRIRDIAFLEKMPQLERLSLYETQVEDLTFLEKMPGLVELALEGNGDTRHVEVVGKLTKLQDLGLQNCGITDISFLSGLTELRSVNLNDNSIEDLSPLAGLTKLERLGASRNRIEDISPLKNMSGLYDLALDENEISDISVLRGFPHLNQARLSDNRITDLSPLADREELMYADVFGNPCTDIRPVWQVPLLYCNMSSGVTDEEAALAEAWVKEYHPEAENYECIDLAEGDLNKDGRTDFALVVEGKFKDGRFEDEDGKAYDGCRRLYILLRQADGSWQEFMDTPGIWDRDSGGMRGDPYDGIFLGEGYLMIKQSWGSSGGGTVRETYVYRDGKLEPAREISVEDCNFSHGYDVTVTDEETDTWIRYAIVMDGYRMVRVVLADSEHPGHKAFPYIDLNNMSFYIHEEKRITDRSCAEVLDHIRDNQAGNAQKAELPYASWQKENYELLFGMELPDYYYIVPETEEAASGKTSDKSMNTWGGDYIFYKGMTEESGELCHIIYYVKQEGGNLSGK